jgi:hypothetical protein
MVLLPAWIMVILILVAFYSVEVFPFDIKGRSTMSHHLPSSKTRLLLRIGENVDPNIDRRYAETFGPVASLVEKVDEVTEGFAFSYADLTGFQVDSLPGLVFLATNLAYEVVGIAIQSYNHPIHTLDTITLTGSLPMLFAGIASINYHWSQVDRMICHLM